MDSETKAAATKTICPIQYGLRLIRPSKPKKRRAQFMSVCCGSSAARSIPQQFIDAGLRPRLLVDALDDHRAIERRTAVLARQRAGHHDRISGHLALAHLAAVTLDDLGRGAEEDAHR